MTPALHQVLVHGAFEQLARQVLDGFGQAQILTHLADHAESLQDGPVSATRLGRPREALVHCARIPLGCFTNHRGPDASIAQQMIDWPSHSIHVRARFILQKDVESSGDFIEDEQA